MTIELKIPAVGESITDVEIGEWLKNEGDSIERDENIVAIESEKATVELPAPESGTRATPLLAVRARCALAGRLARRDVAFSAGSWRCVVYRCAQRPQRAIELRVQPRAKSDERRPIAQARLIDEGQSADDVGLPLEEDRDAERLDDAQEDRPVARVLRDLAAAELAFL